MAVLSQATIYIDVMNAFDADIKKAREAAALR
jgi:hypothetical protein